MTEEEVEEEGEGEGEEGQEKRLRVNEIGAQVLEVEPQRKMQNDNDNDDELFLERMRQRRRLGKGQQVQHPPIVDWERFFPFRSLNVLLVENDNSTCLLVCALLRNCSYQVTATANGLQAWRILQDDRNRIDLVLSEVSMPLLSGIGLLCKIMSHKTYKNIPVIMMSSHDSMVLVIKCLSKGAVDFLVKPIRKNELRNLWQHVWRRQQSSSDSGSGSFIHAQTYEKLKNAEESGNNTGSKDRDENCYSGLNNGDGSDNGSGTQSSWTRQGVEVNSPHPVLICDQTADHSGNTCAQVVFPKTEAFDHVWGLTTVDKSRKQEERLNDNGGVGKVLAPGNTIPNLKDEYSSEKYSINLAGTNENTSPGLHLKKGHDKLNRDLMEPQRENIVAEVKDQASDVICSITANTNDPVQTVFEASNGASKILKMKDKANSDSKVSLEPCSKRPRGIENATGNSHDDHHVLKLSNVSAFSRCASASTAIQAPITDMGSCSPLGNSSKAGRAKSIYNSPNFHLVPNEPSNICSNNINMDSRKQNLIRAGVFDEKSTLATKRLHPSSPLQSLEIVHAGPPQKAVLEENDIRIINILPNHPRALEEQTQVQQHCVQYRQRQKPPHSQDYRSSDDKVVETLQHKSPTVFCCRVEANAGKKFLSPSYSNCERNGQNRRTTNEDVRRMNINFENVVPGKSKSC